MPPEQKNLIQKLLHPQVALVVIGCILVIVAIGAIVTHGKRGITVSQPEGQSEGSGLTLSAPSSVSLPSPLTATFSDPGQHGFVAMQQGGGTFVQFDDKKGLTYTSPATVVGTDGGQTKIGVTIPEGMCGLIIKSAQEPQPMPKMITVTITGPDGKPVVGIAPYTFPLKCDTYTLDIKMTASKDPVLPDGADQSTVTATLSVTGPAQFVNGQRIKAGQQKPTITTPLGYMMVHFETDLGGLAPNPANVKTDLSGQASVTISSPDAGIASVRAIAQGVGDAILKVHFPPKITAVKQDFVEPNSPTKYELQTVPANPKDLDFTWKLNYAGAPPCGSLTGGAQGKALVKNSFFHGPQGTFKDGCPVAEEQASTITVTATDKDGQSDTKTFPARQFEGQGFVKVH
jgi:hypothetical protein